MGICYYVRQMPRELPTTVYSRHGATCHPATLRLPPAGLERILWRNPSYDARPLLQGVPTILGELVRQVRLL